jgi:hypothetical protein
LLLARRPSAVSRLVVAVVVDAVDGHEDYNEFHPHSGLKFLSPREFLRLSA